MLLISIFCLVVLVWLYIMFFRDWLLRTFAGTKYDYYHDQIRALWGRSRTILVGRVYWLAGIVIGIHEVAISAGFDFTPTYRELANLFPERYQPLILSFFLYMTGVVIIKLRTMTAVAHEEADATILEERTGEMEDTSQ